MFYYLLILLFAWTVDTACVTNSTILMNDGNRIPALGLGGWFNSTTSLDQVMPSITAGFEAGFRMVDTAYLYTNEKLLGQVFIDLFDRGVVTREDIFVLTKLDVSVFRTDMVIPAIQEALDRLQLDYVDMVLMHVPDNTLLVPDYDFMDVWRGLEKAKEAFLTKSIGVSNFNSTHLNRLFKYCNIRPAVNEIEVNPTYANVDFVGYCQSQGIVVIGYGPIGLFTRRPYSTYRNPPTFDHPILMTLGKQYEKEPSQIVLRYLIDRGIVPIPRSHNLTHILLNVDLFDFSLTQKEVCTMNQLNLDQPSYPKGEKLGEVVRELYYDLKKRDLL